jgi:hypothetical protein
MSEIVELYLVWRETRDQYNAADMESDEARSIFSAHLKAEAAIFEAAPASIEDMAIKIIVADDNGDMSMSLTMRALVREAYRIAGVPGWTDQDEEAFQDWLGRRAAA